MDIFFECKNKFSRKDVINFYEEKVDKTIITYICKYCVGIKEK